MIERLFVYGTLAPGRQNEHLLNEIGGWWEPAAVCGILHPEGWGATMGYPAIVLDESRDEVQGLLFSSDRLSEHWALLDSFEGNAYKRVSAVVKLQDNSTVQAHVYALNSTPKQHRQEFQQNGIN